MDKQNRYQKNETMRLLGYQSVESPEIRPLLEDLRAAYPDSFNRNYMMVLDAFHLGVILGKQQERARRKAVRS
ncbi:MAG: hypothetical protein LIP12_00755 [Clostridiales bacterium]|nr:hypothetical protein [Clostridiales bacterium]